MTPGLFALDPKVLTEQLILSESSETSDGVCVLNPSQLLLVAAISFESLVCFKTSQIIIHK